jgi:hypothetical protein
MRNPQHSGVIKANSHFVHQPFAAREVSIYQTGSLLASSNTYFTELTSSSRTVIDIPVRINQYRC